MTVLILAIIYLFQTIRLHALVREGINGPVPVKDEKKFAARYKAAPGEILVIARPLSFFERLLHPLTNE